MERPRFMECPKCGKVFTIPGPTCPWCRVLVSNPDAGVIATPGRRLAAYVVEVVLAAIIAGIILASVSDENGGVILFGFVTFLFIVIINLYFMAKGTSMGKRLLGMTVYRTSGKRAGFFLMLVRESIGKFISGLVLSLGFLWLLWDKDVQAWHDKVVGIVVIWEKGTGLSAPFTEIIRGLLRLCLGPKTLTGGLPIWEVIA